MKKIIYFISILIAGTVLFFYLEKQGKNPELNGLLAGGLVMVFSMLLFFNPNRLESVEVDE
jgi:hypothetical protein